MHSLTSSLQFLSIQQTGRNRNLQDKYYTKRSVATHCTQLLNNTLAIPINDILLEPSAGDGAFMEAILGVFPKNRNVCFDIAPERNDILQQDFLQYEPENDRQYHVIGNPPFGRQSSMARKFIQHACTFAQSISFILPKSFKKQSMQKCFHTCFHLLYEEDLPSFSFLVNEKEYDVPCVFQIWSKQENARECINTIESTHFIYVKENENPDFCIRRVGVNAGMIFEECENKSVQSHYFCKLKHGNVKQFITLYKQNIRYPKDNTVGPNSISKNECNQATNQLVFS
jgi:hypothetical protein